MTKRFTVMVIMILAVAAAFAVKNRVSARQDPYEKYISDFCALAVEQQQAHGIPASITLAQGLLESGAGRSRLASEGNNHFGIKCHSDWKGDTMLRDDDAADECFRVYTTAAESYEDHSRFLSRGRYRRLFSLAPGDYAGWARGLRECGYATDPNYADKLITIIERYALYSYDTASGVVAEETAEFIRRLMATSHVVRRSRGLHYVVAVPGDTYGSIAGEFGIDCDLLVEYNDAGCDGPVRAWEEVYLQPKLETAPEGIKKVTVGEDETIRSVAQRYGMKTEILRRLNPLAKDRPGTRLRLR